MESDNDFTIHPQSKRLAYRRAVLAWFNQNGLNSDVVVSEATINDWVEYLLSGWEVPEELARLVGSV